jgi:hypothetical protein
MIKHTPNFNRWELQEDIDIQQGEVVVRPPYSSTSKKMIGGVPVYVLFGALDYPTHKEALLGLKGSSGYPTPNQKYLKLFWGEVRRRCAEIRELMAAELWISIESQSPLSQNIATSVGKPYIPSGFKKKDPLFKIRSIPKSHREGVSDFLYLDFPTPTSKSICVVDDFLTTGTTFRQAFQLVPADWEKVGVCLFSLE